MEVKKIMCACGAGLGSSLMVEMNVNDVLKKLGHTDIEVIHSTLSGVEKGVADLYVVSEDLADMISYIPAEQIIVLTNIIDKAEIEEKLTAKLA